MRRPPFARSPRGVRVDLDADEIVLLTRLPDMLAVSPSNTDDRAQERLTPAAYPDDEEADREYRRLVASQLEHARTTDGDRVAEVLGTLGRDRVVSVEDAEALVRLLGHARLVLTVRYGGLVHGEGQDWVSPVDLDEPATQPELALAQYLGYLQQVLVEVLLEALPTG